MTEATIYKVASAADWKLAETTGTLAPSPDDRRDGFMHFSTISQLQGTLDRHYRGREGLVLLSIAADRLGAELKWEPARDGSLFPHLYGPLPATAVASVLPLSRDATGRIVIPPGLA